MEKKQNENENKQEQKTEQQQPEQQEQKTEQQQKGFWPWVKRHKKGVTATVVGIVTAVSSGFVAYKKGKAAGINMIPVPQENEDGSLNPNE